jgi:ketosteroid isomerase-like protein
MKLPEKKPAFQAFEQFCDGYKKRDLAAVLNLFTENANMWGTGVDEYRVGLKEVELQLKRDWSQSEKGQLEIVSFVPVPADALWAAVVCNARLTIAGKEYLFEHLRGTIVVEKVDGSWKISHMHASFPDYRNAEEGSFPEVS